MAFNVGAPARGRQPIGATLAEINIIPLVDVVLVLLLIFMLTAPMMYRGIVRRRHRHHGPGPARRRRAARHGHGARSACSAPLSPAAPPAAIE